MKIMIVTILLNVAFAAEFPIIRLQGKVTFVSGKVICIAADMAETCFKRSQKYEYLTNKSNYEFFDVLVESDDILKGRGND